jgi:hypothetical protein
MAWRTTETLVSDFLEMDPEHPLHLAPFIDQASTLTDRLSRKDTKGLLLSADLAQIELLLACHFYSLRDPRYANKSTGGASASWQSQTGASTSVSGNDYWIQACQLDETGYLAGLSRTKHIVGCTWGGKDVESDVDD